MQLKLKHVPGVCNAWCQQWRMYDRILPLGFLTGILLFLLYFVTISAPLNFPSATYVKVAKGQTFDQVSHMLEEKEVIRSARVFALAARLYGGKDDLMSGEYFFSEPISVLEVARRVMRGHFQLMPLKITIPEGTSTRQMATLLSKKIPDFDGEAFYKQAKDKEGYLFPDTYFFMPGAEPEDVLATLEENFTRQTQSPKFQEALKKSGKTLEEIVTMASLLEKEAAKLEDRRMVAGILWKRISIGMALQVDAVFPYILGKNTFELTRADLKIDSPYNTYVHKGLPVGPITNPGFESMLAAMTPTKSNYIFYLTDMQSQFHFSVTYAQHLANQKKYLP